MSDYTDNVMDGILCSMCGVYLLGDAELEGPNDPLPGFPMVCNPCAREAMKDKTRTFRKTGFGNTWQETTPVRKS